MRQFWLAAAALIGFSAVVKSGWLVPLDQAVIDGLEPLRGPALDGAMRLLTWLGDPQLVQVFLGTTTAVLWLRGSGRLAASLAAAFLLGFLLEIALRLWVAQWRPDTNRIPVGCDAWIRFSLAGFPSGHAYHAAFLWGWVRSLSREARLRALCLAAIIIVGVSRVYLERHWLTDVLGSWLLAWTVLQLKANEGTPYIFQQSNTGN